MAFINLNSELYQQELQTSKTINNILVYNKNLDTIELPEEFKDALEFLDEEKIQNIILNDRDDYVEILINRLELYNYLDVDYELYYKPIAQYLSLIIEPHLNIYRNLFYDDILLSVIKQNPILCIYKELDDFEIGENLYIEIYDNIPKYISIYFHDNQHEILNNHNEYISKKYYPKITNFGNFNIKTYIKYGNLNLVSHLFKDHKELNYNLILAIKYGQLEIVKYFVSKDTDKNLQYNNIFEEASRNSNYKILEFILEYYGKIYNFDINSGFKISCQKDKPDNLKILLKLSITKELIIDGFKIACEYNSINVIKLLSSYVDIDIINRGIIVASNFGNYEVIIYLTNNGGEINNRNIVSNAIRSHYFNILELAFNNGYIFDTNDVEKAILQYDFENYTSCKIFDFIFKHSSNIDTPYLLNIALSKNSYEISKLLIDKGGLIDNANILQYPHQYNNIKLIILLLDNGVDTHYKPLVIDFIKRNDIYGLNILFNYGLNIDNIDIDIGNIILSNNYNTIKLLLQYGLKINSDHLLMTIYKTNNSNLFKLFYNNLVNVQRKSLLLELLLLKTIEFDNIDIATFLLTKHIDINYNNNLPLKTAIKHNNYHMVSLLIDNNAVINDSELLKIAFYKNNMFIIKLLIDKHVPIKDDFIKLATELNNVELIKLLLEVHKFSQSMLNKSLFIALKNNKYYDIAILLLNYGAKDENGYIYRNAKQYGNYKTVNLLSQSP